MICWQRRPGLSETELDGDLYLVEPGAQDIFHLDSLGAALWRQLAQPTSLDHLLALFAEAFPETPPNRLAADIAAALEQLRALGLATQLPDA